MATTPWADQPFALLSTKVPEEYKNASDGSISVLKFMSLAHNLIICHLNAIYLQATGFTGPDDTRNFLLFTKFWLDELHGHHESEETMLFPMLDTFTGTKGVMDRAEAQHRFGVELRRIIKGFAPALLQHLREEPLLLLEIGERFGGERFRKFWDEFEAKLVKRNLQIWDKHVMLPVAMGINDHGFDNGAHADWPPFPFFLPFVTRVFFSRRHAGA
ncbi:hypothetical protein BJX64DRAFT_286020 [Aspergillus heterothallicus]